MLTKNLTAAQVETILNNKGFYPDELTKGGKDKVFFYRKGFYYTHGNSARKIGEKLQKEFPNIEIATAEDIWKPFRGGATIKQSSHYLIVFKVLD